MAANARIMITGGTGFIGSHVVAAVQARRQVVIVPCRAMPAQPVAGVQYALSDLLGADHAALMHAHRPDVLIHCAWETTHGAFWASPANLDWVAASLSLARAFREAGGRRLVGLGTCFEYALGGSEPLIEGASPCAPTTLYGTAKDATRRVLAAYAASYGLELAWARLFHLFGPAEAPVRLVPAVIAALLRGEEARTTLGTQLRNFIHAGDAGRAIAAVALSDVQGAVNIGASENTTIAALVARIARQVGRPDLVRLGAVPMKPDDPAMIVPCLERLKAIGFTPTFDLDAGLAEMIASMRGGAA